MLWEILLLDFLMWEILPLDFFAVGDSDAGLSSYWANEQASQIFDELAKLGKSTQDAYNRGGWLIL